MNKLLTGAVFSALAMTANVQAADQLAPSTMPPGGLLPSEVPMFVSFGFDDNGYSGYPEVGRGAGGMKWAIDMLKNRTNPAGTGNPLTFDGAPTRVTFFQTCVYASSWLAESPVWVKKAWREAYMDGHEIGNHTVTHAEGGRQRSEADWFKEIDDCNKFLTQPFDPNEVTHSPDPTKGIGIPASEITGFRAPFLEFNDNTFKAMISAGITYDVSIQEGFQADQFGGDHYWPYTLDFGSPGNDTLVSWGNSEPISTYPGFWEIPVYPFIVPDDATAPQYGINYSLRDKAAAAANWFNKENGKITGFDYNLFYTYKFNKAELLATMKYTLDQRLAGNRSPMMLGAHTDMFHDLKSADAPMRREVLEEFLDYALSKPEVRIVRYDQLIAWMKNPVALDTQGPQYFRLSASVVGHPVDGGSCTEPAWSATNEYTGGSRVSHNGNVWEASWWTKGEEPGASTWGPWQGKGLCDTSTIRYFGTVSPTGTSMIAEGQSQVYTLTPEAGYQVEYIELDGVRQQLGAPGSFTLGPVSADMNLVVSFGPAQQ
ncbi:hypothetical protein KDD30_16380 [Photobacterium sp. GJ3]|uniref:polysaccharide deacetylase family protein n=1 Tax=Photobacterium sp. GJ3 TaxID=2829502 RepID=UPI001B8CC8B8|nr:polysaccharide deacetylase family protein [Photobacterium sp. GJ3]QUJ67558.1 hypothetical protein KDD30_16380 [Photobacterium sp. GJ3]